MGENVFGGISVGYGTRDWKKCIYREAFEEFMQAKEVIYHKLFGIDVRCV